MVAAYMNNEKVLGLKDLSILKLNYSMMHIEELIGTGPNQISMADVPYKQVLLYAADDAVVCYRLWNEIYNKL